MSCAVAKFAGLPFFFFSYSQNEILIYYFVFFIYFHKLHISFSLFLDIALFSLKAIHNFHYFFLSIFLYLQFSTAEFLRRIFPPDCLTDFHNLSFVNSRKMIFFLFFLFDY